MSQSRNSRRAARSGRARSSLHAPHQILRRESAGAGVDAERQRGGHFARRCRGRAHQVAEQRQRHVVDRDVAQVLERLQRRRAAGAGQAGDHDEGRRGRPRVAIGGAARGGGETGVGLSGMGTILTRGRSCGRASRSRQDATLPLPRPRTAPGPAAAGDAEQGFALRARAAARSLGLATRSTSRASGARASNLVPRQA